MSTEALGDTQPAARESGPAIASKISRFEIREKLGEGGNGVVLLARDPTLDRNVAIKILRRGGNPEASQRLLREAQSAARISHESVIVVHEVGTHDGQVYVAMEHVAGGTLTTWQRKKPWREVLDIYLRAGRGLAAAHAAGMVHRDFKPDNVLVGDDGRVRVTDFGLVTVSSGKPPEEARDLALTATGTVMGTPRYMAPEQHLGDDVDARTDQFAFCVALYEALFGRAPFEGDTYGALADRVLAGEVAAPPGSDVPAPIVAAILRGLSRRPEDRFPSMTALLAVLSPSAPVRRRWLPWVAVGSLLVVAGSVFVFERQRRTAADTETVRQAFDEGQAAFERADYRSAITAYKRAFLLDPDLSVGGEDYLYNMALAYDRLGDCTEAVAAYTRYLAIGNHIEPAEHTRVTKRVTELGSCQPVDHAPDTADAAYHEGELAYMRGDNAGAVEAFKRGFALEPDLAKHGAAYLFNIGQAYRMMGNCAEAAYSFKRYLVLKTDLDPAKRALLEQRTKELDECAAQQGSATGSATR